GMFRSARLRHRATPAPAARPPPRLPPAYRAALPNRRPRPRRTARARCGARPRAAPLRRARRAHIRQRGSAVRRSWAETVPELREAAADQALHCAERNAVGARELVVG